MDFSHEISLLRLEKQKAVKALDFAKAQKIEENINILKENSKSYRKSSKKANDQNTFENEKLEISGEAVRISSEFTQEVYSVRILYQRMLVDLHEKQAKEMSDLTISLSKDLELCATRSIPQVQIIERDAQFQANKSNYTMANLLLEESKRIRTAVLEERQASVHAFYVEKQEKMIKRHEANMAQFIMKMNNEINDVHNRFNKAMKILKQRYITCATKYGIEITEDEADAFLAPYKINDELGNNPAEADMAKTQKTKSPKGMTRSRLISTDLKRKRLPRSVIKASQTMKPVAKTKKSAASSNVESASVSTSVSAATSNSNSLNVEKKATFVTPSQKKGK